MRRLLPLLALFLFLAACSTPATPKPTLVVLFPSVTPAPAATATLTPLPLPTTSPTPTVTPTETPLPGGPLANYNLDVTINYAAKTVDVVQEITYPNTSGETLKDLLLSVQPNQDTGVFALTALTLDDQLTSEYTLKKQRLSVILPAPLQPGQSIKVGLTYRITVPLIVQGDPNFIRPQIFGHTARQINLVDWYPFIVPYRAGWVLHNPWTYGEHLVYEPANYDVTVRFAGLGPEPVVAASGQPEADLGITHYRMQRARAFAFSISDQFKVLSQQVGNVTINSYYFSDLYTPAGQAVLDATAKAVQTYTDLFGPYPHQTLAAVQGDFNDGMEYDGLYFLSNAFYDLYDKTPQNYLVMVAAHETSHQWWFGRIGSDQSEEPWLDESIATYCEKLFYERNYPDALSWWWYVRVDFYEPSGFIDQSVADYARFDPYTNATYRVGARFYEDLRQRTGDEAFFSFLKDYSLRMNGQITTSADFFRILREHTSADLSDLLAKYFKSPH
jgi:hypothetical protein